MLTPPCSQFVAEAEKASASKASPRAALLRCADLAEELETKAARLATAQEASIMPATAAYVTSKQQWKFNDKVRCCDSMLVGVVALMCTVVIGFVAVLMMVRVLS